MTHKLLIVDDEIANLRLLTRLFSDKFHCLSASSGPEAIRLLEQHDVAILISDQRMPQMTGIELLKRSASLRPHMVRILLTGYTDIEALVEAINSGLVYMYITKPWNNEDLKLRVNRACEHYEQNKARQSLGDANRRLLLRLKEVKLAVVTALTEMLKTRDDYESAHAVRVRNYAMMIAAKIGISEEQEEDLSMAALLHGLGRVGSVRNSAATIGMSTLDQTLQAHFECEAKLLNTIPELGSVAEVISGQQENFDGTGLPKGLRAEQIPLLCRILRLADDYDLMILPKASAPMTHDEAMRFLSQRSGKQFDPMVVEVLSQLSPEELSKQQHSIASHDEYTRLRQGNFELACTDAGVS